MGKYVIGLDYGSLSVRAVLVNLENGEEAAECVYEYPHKVMDQALPTGEMLPAGFALQSPEDYYQGLVQTVKGLLTCNVAVKEEILGIGVDATGTTLLPVKKDKTPLASLEAFSHNPHAWIKMWKHHGGEAEAAQIQALAIERKEEWLSCYGGEVSAEWAFPKILETLHQAPEIYTAADYFIDAADWITWILTDTLTRSTCIYGYKYFYRHDGKGFPAPDFFRALDSRMEHVAEEKLSGTIISVGDPAGTLCQETADLLGLNPGIPVSVALLDAHAAVAGAGVTEPGDMVVVMGTSSCHMLLTREPAGIPGVAGVVYDGIMKGFYGCESGQSCVGDGFAWFLDHFLPASYQEEADQKQISIHTLLAEKLKNYHAGQSGLLALDWFNGVRSPLADFDLNGLILGLNLSTRAEEVYLALIEATAYGTKWIIEQYENAGIPIHSVVLCGGIPQKNPLLVQVYADVLNRTVRVAGSRQSCALGAAMQAVSAGGKELTGFSSITEAVSTLVRRKELVYQPVSSSVRVYETLYQDYRRLCDLFGSKTDSIMKRLNALRRQGRQESEA